MRRRNRHGSIQHRPPQVAPIVVTSPESQAPPPAAPDRPHAILQASPSGVTLLVANPRSPKPGSVARPAPEAMLSAMSLLEESKQCLLDLSALTKGIARGEPPDVHSVLGYQSKLVRY